MQLRLPLLILALGLLPACQQPDAANSHGVDYATVKGEGVVQEIHPDLKYLIMKTTEGSRKAWWDGYSQLYMGQSQVDNLSLAPGDHILYLGTEAFSEIYIHKLIQPDGR